MQRANPCGGYGKRRAMHEITRRDFLNGVAIGTATGLLAPAELQARIVSANASVHYPPTLTGMRGSHPGSYEVAHALAWNGQKPPRHRKLDEHYDLVIVGAGVSGLAAAWFYRQKMGPRASVLLLDNHDDFGGHAKRNEFHQDGRMLLGVGGSVNLDSPDGYSAVAKGLLDDLGIDLEAMASNIDEFALLNMDADNALALPGPAGHVTVGGNWLGFMHGRGDYASAVRQLALPAGEQDKLIELFGGGRDYLDDLSLSEKYAYIQSTTYRRFLTERVGLADETIPIFYPIPKLMGGAAASRYSVQEAIYLGCPGLRGMGWLGRLADRTFVSFAGGYETLYFADGNASVARLLVRHLIPAVAPDARGFDDIAASVFDYGMLDRDGDAVRLRLNSTAVGVREVGNNRVQVDYVRNGDALSVTGGHCVLACYNAAIPHLCPELPESQKEALRYGVKIPLVLTNVLLRNGRAFSKLGAGYVSCPKDPYVAVTTAPPTTTGGFQPPGGPDEPMVVFMLGVPSVVPAGDETARELLLRARHQMYATGFDTYEREIREQLQGLLGAHGFDHETDIRAITVNRWPHGYAYEYMSLDDPEWAEGQAPHELGRARFGRISIANSDAEGRAYLDAAIDAAWRAVEEQTA